MKDTHPPGPWTVRAKPVDPNTYTEHAENERWSVSSNGALIAGIRNQPEDEQNARLIAAAPELLAAAKAAQHMILHRFTRTVREACPEWYAIDSALCDAIAKVEGGTEKPNTDCPLCAEED